LIERAIEVLLGEAEKTNESPKEMDALKDPVLLDLRNRAGSTEQPLRNTQKQLCIEKERLYSTFGFDYYIMPDQPLALE
jgi:hypothetical protein